MTVLFDMSGTGLGHMVWLLTVCLFVCLSVFYHLCHQLVMK